VLCVKYYFMLIKDYKIFASAWLEKVSDLLASHQYQRGH
jgi:hypothetical protein